MMGNRGGPGGRPRDTIQSITWQKSSIVNAKITSSTSILPRFLERMLQKLQIRTQFTNRYFHKHVRELFCWERVN